MNDHVDAEVLAELAEGLLDDETAAAATAHLRDCAECEEVAAALAGVTATLAAAPAPALPAHVAEGIDARLAQEAAARARPGAEPGAQAAETAPEAAASSGSQGAEVTSLSAARRLRWSRALAAAAAAVVLVGGGFAVVNDMLKQQAASGGGAPLAQKDDAGEGEAGKLAAPKAAAPALRSGTDYTSSDLPAQAEALARRAPARTTSASREPQLGTEGAPSAGLGDCLDGIAQRIGRPVLLADEARYEGAPATLVVVAGSSESTAEVLVIPGACTPGEDGVERRVTVPRD